MKRSVQHATIVLERQLAAPPSRVFAAWADPEERKRWDVPDDGWVVHEQRQEFRIGGRELSRFGPKEEPRYTSDGHYLDIVQDVRIVSAGTMHVGERRSSSTLCTVELIAEGRGTRLILTDQSVFYDGLETESERQDGWGTIVKRLESYLGARAQ
jgi:uncharacterized protein YndB with AHSA1/START domain